MIYSFNSFGSAQMYSKVEAKINTNSKIIRVSFGFVHQKNQDSKLNNTTTNNIMSLIKKKLTVKYTVSHGNRSFRARLGSISLEIVVS